MIFVVLWVSIFAFLAVYLGKSPRVRNWLALFFRARKLWRVSLVSVAIVVAIVVSYMLIPKTQETQSDTRRIFELYAAQTVLKLDSLQKLRVDSACDLSHPSPEIAYVLPMIVGAYNSIVEKPTLPVVSRLDDTLYFKMLGYKQFKNRGIRLNKLLQRKLGSRYAVQIISEETEHVLQIAYKGNPWDNEQLMALPVMEAAQSYKVDPALLMSLIRHVSNFDFDYRGQKDAKGLLALHQGDGLEQVYIGAERLGKMLQVGISQENAVASFYPDPEIGAKPEHWNKSPLTKSWVGQVMSDVDFYRQNGLK